MPALVISKGVLNMRFVGTIQGFRNDHNNNDFFNITTFQVNYTADQKGKTLSLADTETGIQFSIPFDGILKAINRGK